MVAGKKLAFGVVWLLLPDLYLFYSNRLQIKFDYDIGLLSYFLLFFEGLDLREAVVLYGWRLCRPPTPEYCMPFGLGPPILPTLAVLYFKNRTISFVLPARSPLTAFALLSSSGSSITLS